MNSKEPAFQRLKIKLTNQTLWIYILRLLQDKAMYGYEIRKHIKARFNFEPATITAYVVLYKMRREALVEMRVSKNLNGRPDRKYYHITPKGNQMMEQAKALIEEIYNKVFDKVPVG